MADANYENVVLLLHADGANGSTQIRDERGHALTCAGTAAISTTQSKFGGSSISINTDVSNRITSPATTDWALPGDFTVECWVYLTAYNTVGGRIACAGGGTVAFNATTGIHWLFQSTATGVIFSFWDGATSSSGPGASVSLNTWTHIAVSRAGSTLRMFKDGTLTQTVTNSAGSPSTTPSLSFGAVPGETSGTTQAFNGFVDDFRITKGLARYTANFTAPTAAYDHVTNSSTDPYFNNVAFQSHFDGVDSTTPAYPDIKNSIITWGGNAKVSTTQSKFGGSSLALDGSGDYVSTPSKGLVSVDFTVEAWIFLTVNNVNQVIVATYNGVGFQSNTLLFAVTPTGKLSASNGTTGPTGTTTLSTGVWHHVAATYTSATSTIQIFLNGVSEGSGTGTISNSAANMYVGGSPGDNNIGTWWFNGYIDDLRITKGVKRYTATFTPPAAAFSDAVDETVDPFYSNVVLLQHMDDAALADVKGHTVTLNGNAARSSTQSKFGGFSAAFDGSGDYLALPNSVDWAFGTGDFTIEAWIYSAAPTGGGVSNDRLIFGQIASVTNMVAFLTNDTNAPAFWDGSVQRNSSILLQTNTWTHVAWCRAGGVLKIFVNGREGFSVSGHTINFTVQTPITVGGSASNLRFMNGYIDDIRVTKGVGRYLTQFQAPTQAFPGFLFNTDMLYLNQSYTVTAPTNDSLYANQQYALTAPTKDSLYINQQYALTSPATDRLNVNQQYIVNAPIRDGLYTNQQYAIQQPIRDSLYINQQWGTNVVLVTHVTLDSPINVGTDLTAIKAILTTLDSHLNVLSTKTFSFKFPVLLLSRLNASSTFTTKQIIGVLLNSILYAQPLLSARYATGATLIETANTWVLNIETNATSQYDNFGFNSFATTSDGRQLACAEDGIYAINQSVSSTDVVHTLVQFPKTNFGTSAATNVHEVWLGVASHDKLVIKTITEQGTFYYTARTNTDTLDVSRVDLGKGVKSNYWDISLIGSTDLELETIEFFPISTSRRI